MVFIASPQLGPDIETVYDDPAHFDHNGMTQVSPVLGTKAIGSDGGEYFWVQASGDVSATATTGTQVTMTFATHTIATGSGGFYTPPATAVGTGQFCWVRRGAWNANPA